MPVWSVDMSGWLATGLRARPSGENREPVDVVEHAVVGDQLYSEAQGGCGDPPVCLMDLPAECVASTFEAILPFCRNNRSPPAMDDE